MAETNLQRTGLVLTGALVLAAAVAVGGLLPAAAQEESAPAAQESPAAEPVQREGIWVEISLGTDIDMETRAVVGEAATFPPDGERVFCLTRVHGMTPPATVTHVWYFEGKTMARVDLAVGSQNWRTWSFKTYKPDWTGSWEVKVLDEDGMVLGSAGFEVK